MPKSYTSTIPLPEAPVWQKQMSRKDQLLSINMEVTARCNNNCRHCYINVPADNREAIKNELSLEKIKDIADQACSLGAIWCLLTGGEPLLRDDFEELYLYLKKKGLLVSVFTNAALITPAHIDLFKKWPPRSMEVSVYGVTEKTYERVTRKPGSFKSFMRGLNLMLGSGIPVILKAMAIQSNIEEFEQIALFCKQNSSDNFRFDPLLHLRFDRDKKRNREIVLERLTPEEIAALDRQDYLQFLTIKKACANLTGSTLPALQENLLFSCGTGLNECTIGYDGKFRLCSSLHHPDCIYDLNKGSLLEALNSIVPAVRDMRSKDRFFLENCSTCSMTSLCNWCPAHAYLETGELDSQVPYFCDVARLRLENLENK